MGRETLAPTQKVAVGQSMSVTGHAGSPTVADCQVPAPPVGFVDQKTFPAGPPTTHSDVVGQLTSQGGASAGDLATPEGRHRDRCSSRCRRRGRRRAERRGHAREPARRPGRGGRRPRRGGGRRSGRDRDVAARSIVAQKVSLAQLSSSSSLARSRLTRRPGRGALGERSVEARTVPPRVTATHKGSTGRGPRSRKARCSGRRSRRSSGRPRCRSVDACSALRRTRSRRGRRRRRPPSGGPDPAAASVVEYNCRPSRSPGMWPCPRNMPRPAARGSPRRPRRASSTPRCRRPDSPR